MMIHDSMIISDWYIFLAQLEESVYEELTRLNTTKSVGSDGISGKVLKMTAVSTVPQLTALFNMSISTGKFPSEWKIGRIVPIPKGKQIINK